MKKVIVLAAIALTVFTVVGCGSTAKSTGSSDSYYQNPANSK